MSFSTFNLRYQERVHRQRQAGHMSISTLHKLCISQPQHCYSMYRICKTRPWSLVQDHHAFEFHRLHIPEPTAAVTSKGVRTIYPTHAQTEREMATSDATNDVEGCVGSSWRIDAVHHYLVPLCSMWYVSFPHDSMFLSKAPFTTSCNGHRNSSKF